MAIMHVSNLASNQSNHAHVVNRVSAKLAMTPHFYFKASSPLAPAIFFSLSFCSVATETLKWLSGLSLFANDVLGI